jgi:hypothetical protein
MKRIDASADLRRQSEIWRQSCVRRQRSSPKTLRNGLGVTSRSTNKAE